MVFYNTLDIEIRFVVLWKSIMYMKYIGVSYAVIGSLMKLCYIGYEDCNLMICMMPSAL